MKLKSATLILSLVCAVVFSAWGDEEKTVHDFKAEDIEGNEVALSKFKGKVLLIVNVASECGVTPQYASLQKLHLAGEELGLVVLGFPSNEFGGQEPGSNEEIKNFCSTEYGVTFSMFAKTTVEGDDQIPLFRYLTTAKNPDREGDVGWNFEKFLIGKDGKLLRRFDSNTEPGDSELVEAILKALDQ